MYGNAARRYQQVQVTTATPGELLLALYDGLFRFLHGAKLCYEKKQLPRGREQLSRAHAILSELMISLDDSQAPELCAQLRGIYEYCTNCILQIHIKRNPALIDDILRALQPLHEAWREAVPQAAREQALQASPQSRPVHR